MPTMYEVLVAEASRVGWPRHFLTDLTVHDHELLADPPGWQFIWILREHGTHLYFIAPAPSRRAFEFTLGLMRYHQRHERCHWYVGDIALRTLTPVTDEEAIRRYQEAQPPDQATGPATTWHADWAGLLASRGVAA